MVECHFYPFFKKKMTWVIVSSGIQSMVNDAYLLFNDDAFLFKFNDAFYLESFIILSFHLPPFPSFPITFIHFFPTLKFLSNPKNFKQTLSIACV